MDIVEHYAKLTDVISQLEHQASTLRHNMLPFAHLRNAQYQGQAQQLAAHSCKPERLSAENLHDPQFWDVGPGAKVDERLIAVGPAFLRPDHKKQVDVLRYRC